MSRCRCLFFLLSFDRREMTSEDPTVDLGGDAAPPFSAEQLAWMIAARHSTFPVGSGAAGGDSSRTPSSEAGKTLFFGFVFPATTRVAPAWRAIRANGCSQVDGDTGLSLVVAVVLGCHSTSSVAAAAARRNWTETHKATGPATRGPRRW